MQSLALVLLLFSADPQGAETPSIPENFRAYFERAEEKTALSISADNENLKALNRKYKMANGQKEKLYVHAEQVLAKMHLDDIRKSKPFDYLPAKPKVGDIGRIPACRMESQVRGSEGVVEVGERRMVVRVAADRAIIAKAGEAFDVIDVWVVVDTQKDTRGGRAPMPVLEIVPTEELEKHRANYEAEKKAEKVRAAAERALPKPQKPGVSK